MCSKLLATRNENEGVMLYCQGDIDTDLFALLIRWRFYLQELGDGHWISVSRGPPEDIVDAWGDFTDSLDNLRLSDAQMKASSSSGLAYKP